MPVSIPKERRFFLCTGQCVKASDLHKYSGNHIIGDLRYMTDEGRRVTALALWETPVSVETIPPLKPVDVAYIIGDARLIRCRYAECRRIQRWEIGRAGVLALMDRLGLQERYLEAESHEPV